MQRVSKITTFFLFPTMVFLVHLTAKGLGVYETYPNVDILFHFLGGLSVAYTCAQVLSYLESERLTGVLHRALFLVLLLSLTATATVFWELAEFLSDQFLNTSLQPSIANTMQDQFLGIVGGSTWALIHLRHSKLNTRQSSVE